MRRRWSTTRSRATGLSEAERLLGETLEEEKKADALLTQVAEGLMASKGAPISKAA